MLRETILNILYNIWPMVIIVSVILISLRLTYLFVHKEKFIFYKETFMLGLVIYVLCLFHVVTFQDVSWSGHNFIPFKEILRYDLGTKLFYKNIFGNMLLFLPYGVFIAKYVKTDKKLIVILLAFITSLSIILNSLEIKI